jgi:Methyltransferase domain
MHNHDQTPPPWQAFIAGSVYADEQAPWRADRAFVEIAAHPGLRDSIGGRVAPALRQAIGLVQALTGVDLVEVVGGQRPAQGLCLGFGMNSLEPYDVLQAFRLDQVHAYEWVAEQVLEAAQTLQALRLEEPSLPRRIRLHHGTVSDLRALADASIGLIYTANVFTWEVPMMPETFNKAIQEIFRVLVDGGVVLSRGSAGVLEAHLARHGRMLLPLSLISVFQKGGQ